MDPPTVNSKIHEGLGVLPGSPHRASLAFMIHDYIRCLLPTNELMRSTIARTISRLEMGTWHAADPLGADDEAGGTTTSTVLALGQSSFGVGHAIILVSEYDTDRR